MRHYRSTTLLILLLAGWMVGCGSSVHTAGGSLDTQDIVADLRSNGVVVSPRGPAIQPFFSVTGDEFDVVTGGTIEIYEYENSTAAQSDANRINLSQVDAVSSPHFHRLENIIAVYFGNEPQVEQALTSSLGPPLI